MKQRFRIYILVYSGIELTLGKFTMKVVQTNIESNQLSLCAYEDEARIIKATVNLYHLHEQPWIFDTHEPHSDTQLRSFQQYAINL